MTQTSLPLRPLARTTDPRTSHEAYRTLRADGTLPRGMRQTLLALHAWERAFPTKPSPTSAELACGDQRLRYLYARRLADLRELGLVANRDARRCHATGRAAMTWALTVKGHAACA